MTVATPHHSLLLYFLTTCPVLPFIEPGLLGSPWSHPRQCSGESVLGPDLDLKSPVNRLDSSPQQYSTTAGYAKNVYICTGSQDVIVLSKITLILHTLLHPRWIRVEYLHSRTYLSHARIREVPKNSRVRAPQALICCVEKFTLCSCRHSLVLQMCFLLPGLRLFLSFLSLPSLHLLLINLNHPGNPIVGKTVISSTTSLNSMSSQITKFSNPTPPHPLLMVPHLASQPQLKRISVRLIP